MKYIYSKKTASKGMYALCITRIKCYLTRALIQSPRESRRVLSADVRPWIKFLEHSSLIIVTHK